jgi:chemotaxis protein methyltransferase CheR
MAEAATAPLLAGLSEACGLDLAAYRSDHVTARVQKAIEREGVADEPALLRLIRRSQTARQRFRRAVAVPVSGLYRDPAQFEQLRRELLPDLLAAGRRLRVWSAGCADGSELYTVAFLLQHLGALERSFLLGSDVLEENLAAARAGVYDGQTISPAVGARARWEQRDITRGRPAGRWNLILCRNVAIYFAAEAKARLHASLAAALAASGVLLLGRSERIADPGALGLVGAGRNAYRRRP